MLDTRKWSLGYGTRFVVISFRSTALAKIPIKSLIYSKQLFGNGTVRIYCAESLNENLTKLQHLTKMDVPVA
jgi:hypothetical protein